MNEPLETTPENIRPWGRYDILEEGESYKVKRITVNQGGRLSYQSHEKRTEFWIVVSGTAVVTLDDVRIERTKGESVEIPVKTKHRMENAGREPVVFIEVQTGTYFGEDDIVRYSDDYGRT